ncbi:MAG: cell division protein FtsL [Coriobacteriaceae bacterium]|nr:cell division protein FtsL [Coriobacteriaceae bacterium]
MYGTGVYSTATYHTYVYGSAVPAPRPEPRPEPAPEPRPDVRVLPGRGESAAKLATLSATAVNIFKLALVATVLVAVVAVARVALCSATVESNRAIQDLEAQITTASAETNELEIEHSLLSNPTRVEKEAKKLGMSTPAVTTPLTVELYSDPVLNKNGTISLSKTLAKLKGARSISVK